MLPFGRLFECEISKIEISVLYRGEVEKMLYNKEEKQKLEEVISILKEYIECLNYKNKVV